MKQDIDDLLNSVFGSRRTLSTDDTQNDIALPELHADGSSPAKTAGKPAASKSTGKVPLPTLNLHKPASGAKPAAKPAAKPVAPQPTAAQGVAAVQKGVLDMQDALNARLAAQQQEIEALGRSAQDDIARIQREMNTPAVQNLATQPQATAVQPGSGGAGAEAFSGLGETLGETVLGQDAFLQQLVIAFKRPYIMGHTGETARNSMLLTGGRCTGKHLGLSTIVGALHTRGVLLSKAIAWVDLSLYPTSAEEKLFLQDLYMALAGEAEVVAITHYEACHSGFLSVLTDLVQQGKSPLANRYVLQNGRLIEAGNALVTDAVSALTARGKYLVLLSEKPAAKLADSFGGPFVAALGDLCETQPLSTETLHAISVVERKKMSDRALQNLRYTLTCSDDTAALAAQGCVAGEGASAVLSFWDAAYRALAQHKLQQDKDEPCAVLLTVEGGALAADFGSGAQSLLSLLPQVYAGTMDEVKAELAEIVGLTEIKEYILSLEDNFKMQQRRRAEGLKTSAVSMHMIFTGNPGTGKTTIARLVSKYLKAIGVLSGGQLVEVTRADLVGKYVGHTAPLTTQIIKSAVGGVLFIDEAYSLYRGKDDSFGLEAIDTLVKGMEDNRENLLVILAGYSKEMAEFLTANSGLKSRFPNIIEFPDYTAQELLDITKLQAKAKGYTLEAACDDILRAYFGAVQLHRARDAGNGRLARNKLEEAVLTQARRLLHDAQGDLSLLTTQDFTLDDI